MSCTLRPVHRPDPQRTYPHGPSSCAALLICCFTAAAQTLPQPPGNESALTAIDSSISRPATAGRVVRVFTFDEAATNPFPVPDHWTRAQSDPGATPPRERPGFPNWNQADLDYSISAHPDDPAGGAVRLRASGGSTCLRLDPGVLPIFPGADYAILAKVRTQGLTHARATLIARFLDKSGAPLAAGEWRSALVNTNGAWQDISVELLSESPDAAYIQIDLDVLQPQQFTTSELGKHQVWPEDIHGLAWFDDVSVTQLPRVQISLQSPVNIVFQPDRPRIDLTVRDLTGEALQASAHVLDTKGQEVAAFERRLSGGGAHAAWDPDLPQPGWYRVTLDVLNDRGLVGSTHLDLLWLPAAATHAPASAPGPAPAGDAAAPNADAMDADRLRFGLVAQDLPAGLLSFLPELAHTAGAGAVTLPIWSADLTESDAPGAFKMLAPTIDALLGSWLDVTLCLAPAPAELARKLRLDASDPLALLGHDEVYASPDLLPFLDKHGQRVRRWQVGPIGGDAAFWSAARVGDNLGARLDAADARFSKLVPGPIMTVPWRADRALPRKLGSAAGARRAVAALLPAALPPESLPLLADTWKSSATGAGRPELTLVFELLPLDQFGAQAGVADLVKRTLAFWEAFPRGPAAGGVSDVRAALLDPWSSFGDRRPTVYPRPELGVWRTLGEHLCGRRVVGRLQTIPGTTVYILGAAPDAPSSRGGCLVAWRDFADPGDAVLRAALGPGPVTAFDPFDNPTVYPLAASSAAGASGPASPVHAVPLTETPIFIENIDVGLVRFLSAVHLDPAFLPATNTDHELHVVIDNPWPGPMEGRFIVSEPGGGGAAAPPTSPADSAPGASSFSGRDRSWHISPRSAAFSIPAGQTARLPLAISFSPVEETGAKELIFEFDVAGGGTGGGSYQRVRVPARLDIGLESLKMDLTIRPTPTPDGPDLFVSAEVVNTGASTVSLNFVAFAPGLPRAKASVAALEPGGAITRFFSFAGGAKLKGQRITVSVYDPEHKARLNKSVLIE
jgi:hypothetical protein